MINKVTLVGNVGQTPRIADANGTKVAQLSIATTEKWTDRNSGEKREATEWHNVVAFGKQAENIEKYVQKGAQLYVEGKLKTRSYENREGVKMYRTEVYVEIFKILGHKAPGTNQAVEQQAEIYDSMPEPSAEGDLPF